MTLPKCFNAYYAEEVNGAVKASVREVPFENLPTHEVIIQVNYSSLNYKDALSATGQNHVTRTYPHIPGIDAAGIIMEDSSSTFSLDTNVIVTGHDLGTNTFGGFGKVIRVPKEWVMKLPDSISLKESMIYGTAGFTAMYGIERLKRELITPQSGRILVTGATGGVGSLAIFFLSQLGYTVIATTRKHSESSFLKSLGATDVITTDELLDVSSSPLLSRKWVGAIETVGGKILDAVLRQTRDKGAVACCGNILGKELNTNVYPFILRGISLLGIDSAFCERTLREKIWYKISLMPFDRLPDSYFKTVSLIGLGKEVERILSGDQIGRVVLEHT